MLMYTLRTKACGFSDFKPCLANTNDTSVAAKRTRFPMMSTAWSNPERSKKFLPARNNAFRRIKKMMTGSSALLFLRIVIFLFRGFFYNFINNPHQHNHRQYQYQQRCRNFQPLIDLYANENSQPERHKYLGAHAGIAKKITVIFIGPPL